MKRDRYKITIRHHGLRDYDAEKVNYVFEASSPKDAIRRVEKVYQRTEASGGKLSYYARQFLEAVAISADADLNYKDWQMYFLGLFVLVILNISFYFDQKQHSEDLFKTNPLLFNLIIVFFFLFELMIFSLFYLIIESLVGKLFWF